MLMFLKKMRKSKAGYTLTELIVVVTVLGILAAVATPFVGDYITDARASADVANAKVIEDILARYVTVNGSLPADDKLDDEILKELKSGIPESQQGLKFVLDKDTFKVLVAEGVAAGKNQVVIE